MTIGPWFGSNWAEGDVDELSVQNQFAGRADTVVQAGQIHGGVHLHGRQPRLHLPQQWSRREAESAATDALADAVFEQWRRTVQDRRLFPEPIPVRWTWRRRPLADPVTSGVVSGPFDPLPGFVAIDADAVPTGTVNDLLSVYAGLRSGRAVVLGDVGSGKSDAAAWTVFQALRSREPLDREKRARFPVPILLTITRWDHHRQSLHDWLVGKLEAQYAFLHRGRFGHTMARRLLDSGRIALFLDSLDEMEPEARRTALEQIDRRAPYRVVIFSRPEEFDAIRAGRLRGAAELTLSPVSPGDAAAYLRTCYEEHPPGAWERLTTLLDDQPTGLLARALDSPLMLTLVRDAFPQPADVRVLLESRYTTRQEVHSYLLDRIVDVVYQPSPDSALVIYEATNARRWLSYLAAGMTARGTYSLDWRQLPRWKSALPRIAVTTAVIMVAAALGGAMFFGPGGYIFFGDRTDNLSAIPHAVGGLVIGLWNGLAIGLALGVAAELRRPAPSQPGRRFRRFAGRDPRRRRFNLGVGVAVGISLGGYNVNYFVRVIPEKSLLLAVTMLYSVGTGAVAGWVTARPHPAPGRTRRSRWELWYSRFPLLPGLAGGLAVSVQYWYPEGISGGPHLYEGMLNAVWGTLFATIGIGAIRPHSHISPVIGGNSDWRQEIRQASAYGALFGITLGLGYGLRDIFMWLPPGGHPKWDQTVPALWQTIGLAVPFSVAFGLTICDPWRTSLLFLQLRGRRAFTIRGMHFLEDAYRRRLLRAEGSRFQFRHALLQDTLAEEHVSRPARPPRSRLGASAFTIAAVTVLGIGLWLLWLATANVLSGSPTAQLWAARVGDNAPAGQCIATEDSWNTNKNTVLSAECDQPHWGEVLGYPALSAIPSPYPGDDQVHALASFECQRLRAQHSLPVAEYTMADIVPSAQTWNSGTSQSDNYTACVVYRIDGRPITTNFTVAPSIPPPENVSVPMDLHSATIYGNAPVGACVESTVESPMEARSEAAIHAAPIVRCTQPHWAEILGYPILYQSNEPWPGDNQVHTKATSACQNMLAQRTLPPSFTVHAIWPDHSWPRDPQTQIYAACLAVSR